MFLDTHVDDLLLITAHTARYKLHCCSMSSVLSLKAPPRAGRELVKMRSKVRALKATYAQSLSGSRETLAADETRLNRRVIQRTSRNDRVEREIYIFPWLQVHITGPRHHLASRLRTRAQGI